MENFGDNNQVRQGSIKFTVLFENPFWVGIFERYGVEGYSVARHIFGDEPSSPDVYNFLLKHTDRLRFTTPQRDEPVGIVQKNPKRLQREARKEMKEGGRRTVSKAHDAMRKEIEKNKVERKQQTKAEREAEAERKFLLKQEKRKQKHKGH